MNAAEKVVKRKEAKLEAKDWRTGRPMSQVRRRRTNKEYIPTSGYFRVFEAVTPKRHRIGQKKDYGKDNQRTEGQEETLRGARISNETPDGEGTDTESNPGGSSGEGDCGGDCYLQ